MIRVKILKVVDADTFLLKEDGGSRASEEERQFQHLCELMNNHFSDEQAAFAGNVQPCRGEVYIVRSKNKEWRRARVTSVMRGRGGTCVSCKLLDYGEMETIGGQWLREAPPEYLKLPFQAKEFVLYGLRPLTLVSDMVEMTTSMQPSDTWDIAAKEEVTHLCKEATKVEVKIIKSSVVDSKDVKHVEMFLTTPKGGRYSLNDRLIARSHAVYFPDSPDRCFRGGEDVGVVNDLELMEPDQAKSSPSPQPDLLLHATDCSSSVSDDSSSFDKKVAGCRTTIVHRRRPGTFSSKQPDVTKTDTSSSLLNLKESQSSIPENLELENDSNFEGATNKSKVILEREYPDSRKPLAQLPEVSGVDDEMDIDQQVDHSGEASSDSRRSPLRGVSPAHFSSPPPVFRSRAHNKLEELQPGGALSDSRRSPLRGVSPARFSSPPPVGRSQAHNKLEELQPGGASSDSRRSPLRGVSPARFTSPPPVGRSQALRKLEELQPGGASSDSRRSPLRGISPARFSSPPPVGRSQALNKHQEPSLPAGRGLLQLAKSNKISPRGRGILLVSEINDAPKSLETMDSARKESYQDSDMGLSERNVIYQYENKPVPVGSKTSPPAGTGTPHTFSDSCSPECSDINHRTPSDTELGAARPKQEPVCPAIQGTFGRGVLQSYRTGIDPIIPPPGSSAIRHGLLGAKVTGSTSPPSVGRCNQNLVPMETDTAQGPVESMSSNPDLPVNLQFTSLRYDQDTDAGVEFNIDIKDNKLKNSKDVLSGGDSELSPPKVTKAFGRGAALSMLLQQDPVVGKLGNTPVPSLPELGELSNKGNISKCFDLEADTSDVSPPGSPPELELLASPSGPSLALPPKSPEEIEPLSAPSGSSPGSSDINQRSNSLPRASPVKRKVTARLPLHVQQQQSKRPVTFSDTEEVFDISQEASSRKTPPHVGGKPAKSILKKSPSIAEAFVPQIDSLPKQAENPTERFSPDRENVVAEEEDVSNAQVRGASSRNRFSPDRGNILTDEEDMSPAQFRGPSGNRFSPDRENVVAEEEDVRLAQVRGATSGNRLMKLIGVDLNTKKNLPSLETLYWNDLTTLDMGVLTDGELKPRFENKMEESNIDYRMKEKMFQMEFASPKLIQQFFWPAVLHGRDAVGIAPRNEGKTLAHLAPLISLQFQRSLYAALPKSNGPIVLILSSSWKKAVQLYDLLARFVAAFSAVQVKLVFGAGMEESQKVSLFNGCDILVATPSCLLRMIDEEVLYLDRVCHVVLDDGDILVENFTAEVRDVMNRYLEHRPENESSYGPRQFLILGSQWTPGIKQFCETYMQNYLVFITDKFEAALYGGVKQVAHVCSDHQRVEQLLSLLSSSTRGKTVVFTPSTEEAVNLHKILWSHSIYTHLAHKSLTTMELDSVSREWCLPHREDSQPVLVITDETLMEIKAEDASVVVHFNIPDTKSSLGKRLWCMRQNFKRPICDKESNTNFPQCVSHFLVTKKNGRRVPHLIQILQQTNNTIPVQLTRLADSALELLEEKKISNLCSYFKAYGECRDMRRCNYRHIISAAADTPGGLQDHPMLPTAGEVKVLVTYIQNASNYFVRLLEHKDIHGKVTKYSSEFGPLTLAMNLFFNVAANRQNVTGAELHGLYAIEDTQHSYHRVQVIELKPESRKTSSQKVGLVRVAYKDQGRSKLVNTSELFILPPHLSSKAFKFQAVEVYICRIKPMDNDIDWTHWAGYFVTGLLQPKGTDGRPKGKELLGKVVLCLGNTLWLDPLVGREELPEVGITTNRMSVRRRLLEEGYATDNPQHMELLYASCEGKVQLPEVLEPSKNPAIAFSQVGHPVSVRTVKFPNINDNWNSEYVDVTVKHVDDPGLFFVQLASSRERYNDLLDEIEDFMKLSDEEPQAGIKLGTLVLSRHPDEEDYRWFRGKVVDLREDEYDVLYLDHGEREFVLVDNVRLMPTRFLYLPFQVMECGLAQVEPKGDDWSDEDGDCLYDLTIQSDDNGEIKKTLLARVCDKEAAGYIGTTKYFLELYDTTSEFDVNLNQELVALGHANVITNFIKDRFLNLNIDRTSCKTETLSISDLCTTLLSTKDFERRKKIAHDIKNLVGELSDAGDHALFGSLRGLCHLICYLENAEVFDVVVDCIVMLAKMNEINVHEVTSGGQGINILCRILARVMRTGDAQMEESVTWALAELSVLDLCALEIRRCGGLRLLAELLIGSQHQKAQEAAAKTLIHLVCTIDDMQTNDVITSGVLDAVDHQLAIANPTQGVLSLCLKLIQALAVWPRLQEKLRVKEVLASVYRLAKSLSEDDCVGTTISVLHCLESLVEEHVENKRALISYGMIEVLDRIVSRYSEEDPVYLISISLREQLQPEKKSPLKKSPSRSSTQTPSPSTSPSQSPAQSGTELSRPGSSKPFPTGSGRGALIARLLNMSSVPVPIPGIRQLPTPAKPEPKQAITVKRIPNLSQQQAITRRSQPLCKWCQDRWNILLSIQVKDVAKDADCASFTHQSVSFRAVIGDTEYQVDYSLYEFIDTEQCEVDIRPGEVLLGLRKVSRGRWPRLQSAKEDVKLLRVDFDRLVESSSESDVEDDIKEVPGLQASSVPCNMSPIQTILSKNRSKHRTLMPRKNDQDKHDKVDYKQKPGFPEGWYSNYNESSSSPASELSESDDDNTDYFRL